MKFTTFITIFVGLQFATLISTEECCSIPGYTRLPDTGMCIKLHETFKSWSEAKDTCTSEGTALLTIQNQAELDAVKKHISCALSHLAPAGTCNTKSHIWVGGNDKKMEGEFHWQNGDAFTKWQLSKTYIDNRSCDGKADPDCITIEMVNSGWHDRHCDYKLPFVCQI